MNVKYSIVFISIFSIHSITLPHNLRKFSLNTVYSWFGKYTNEVIIEKEYQVAKPAILTINNITGDIVITTEWQQDSICLKAIKKTAKQEDLDTLTITAKRKERFNGNHLTLTTACSNKNARGAIDYHLIVPAHIALNLRTDYGQVQVNNVNGPLIITTKNGNIQLSNVGNTVTAQTEETGMIHIEKARGNIKATTNKGDIVISDATKSITAHTQKGNIITACNDVPAKSRIVLNSQESGGITLALPTSINATVLGKTTRGRLTSDHYITIKPFTTKLTKQARKDLEKQVDGIIGTGDADIRLMSNNGNIKILEMKTT